MKLITDHLDPSMEHIVPDGAAEPVGTVQAKGEYYLCSHWNMRRSTTFWEKQKAIDWVLNMQQQYLQTQLQIC